MKQKINTLISLFLSIPLSIILAVPLQAQAQAGFGGPVTNMQLCNTGFLLTVGAPTAGTYMYLWGSTPFPLKYFPTSGSFILGTFGPPLICILGVCPVCTTYGAGPTVLMFGTS